MANVNTKKKKKKKDNTRAKIAFIGMGIICFATFVLLICLIVSLITGSKDEPLETKYSSEHESYVADLVEDGNDVLDYFEEVGKDQVVYSALCQFVKEYFYRIDSGEEYLAYIDSYAHELLATFGYELSYEKWADGIRSLRDALDCEDTFVQVRGITYYDRESYYLLEFELSNVRNFNKAMNLVYTIYYDDDAKSYKLLDFDVASIDQYYTRFEFTNEQPTNVVPNSPGLSIIVPESKSAVGQ